VPLLATASVCVTWAVYCAFAGRAAGVVDHVPPDTVTVLIVCSSVPVVSGPLKIFTVTVVASALCVASAVCVPAVPEIVGVVVFTNAAGAVTVGAGAAVSITNTFVPLPLLPAPSP